jgi:hypothetical protein
MDVKCDEQTVRGDKQSAKTKCNKIITLENYYHQI